MDVAERFYIHFVKIHVIYDEIVSGRDPKLTSNISESIDGVVWIEVEYVFE